jgi:hypothetical protein
MGEAQTVVKAGSVEIDTEQLGKALTAATGRAQEAEVAEIRDRAEREISEAYEDAVTTFAVAAVAAVLAASPFVAASVFLASGTAVVGVGVVVAGPVLAAAVSAARTVDPGVDESAFATMVRTLRDQVVHDLEDEAGIVVHNALVLTRGRSEAEQGRAIREALDPKGSRWKVHIERTSATLATAAVAEGVAVGAAEVQRRTGRRIALRWRDRGDGKVRPTHRRANGQVRPVGERFDVGMAKLRWPGDPLAPAEERSNCRCVLIPTRRRE